MIDYETYCKIQDHRTRQGLTITQTAQALGLHPQTVSKWWRIEHYRRRAQPKRASRLDPYKGLIVRWLDAHPLSAQQVFQRLREADFKGVAGVNYFFLRVASPRNVTRLPHAVCYRISIRLQSHINLILAPVRRRSRRAVSAAQGRGEVRHTRVFRLSDSLDDLVGSHGAISAVACSWPLVWLASAVDRSPINACERA